MRKISEFIFDTLRVVAVSLVIILPIRYFLVQPFVVQGASMEPTFHTNDYVIVDELSYRLHKPQRGDVVVFTPPANVSREYFIKRVIGLPGETVEIKDGKIFIQGKNDTAPRQLHEAYLGSLQTLGDIQITLKSNEIYVMGDNRGASYDSRSWGPLPLQDIAGRAWIRLLPSNSLSIFNGVSYSTQGN